MTTRLRWGAASDAGRVRSNNEDNALVDETVNLFAVADGMGGHAAGEVASQMAVEALKASTADTARSVGNLIDGVRLANRAVYERAGSDPELRGMGTTLCALALVEEGGEEQIAVVNVGDSRVYLMQGGELTQLSQDHSLVEDMVRSGQISAEEAKVHPQRNIVTRVLGIDPEVEVDSWQITPYTGDRYLLCSDGLFDEIDDGRIAAVLRRLDDPAQAARELVRLANESGGRDNITCVVVEVADDGGRAREASAALADEPTRVPSPTVVTSTPRPDDIARDRTSGGPGDAEPDRPARRTGRGPEPEPRPRRFTWRVGLFVFVLVVLLGGIVAAIAWFARGTYFVGLDDDEVVIYKGQPGGLLWFDPTVEERTGLAAGDLRSSLVDRLRDGHETASLGAARRYVERLEEQTSPTSTTTTTATAGTTTTVTAPGAPPVTGAPSP